MDDRQHMDLKIDRLTEYIANRAKIVTGLGQLADSLSQIVCAWEEFQKGDIKYFRDDNVHSNAEDRRRASLHVVERQYSELRMRLLQLQVSIGALKDDHVSRPSEAGRKSRGEYFSNLLKPNALLDSSIKKRSHTLAVEQDRVHKENATATRNINNASMVRLSTRESRPSIFLAY